MSGVHRALLKLVVIKPPVDCALDRRDGYQDSWDYVGDERERTNHEIQRTFDSGVRVVTVEIRRAIGRKTERVRLHTGHNQRERRVRRQDGLCLAHENAVSTPKTKVERELNERQL